MADAVSETVRSVESLLRWIYSSFVFRDLVYVSSGMIILAIPIVAHELWPAIQGSKLALLALIVAAHHVGLATTELMTWSGLTQMFPSEGRYRLSKADFVRAETAYIESAARFGNMPDVKEPLLRIMALKHLFASTASAALVAALVLVAYRVIADYRPYAVGGLKLSWAATLLSSALLAAYCAVCVMANRRKAAVQAGVISGLGGGTQA